MACDSWTSWISLSGSSGVQSANYRCYESQGYTWRVSCENGSCQEINVFAHYLLDKDLGSGRIVQIEAFDNKQFQGAPKASVQINSFHARKGEWKEAKLVVAPGEYYIRAFIGSTSEVAVPYQLGGMKAVRGNAFGVYGALSAPEKVTVYNDWSRARVPDPVHLKMETLVIDPDTEIPTEARIRFTINVADMTKIQMGRSVIVQLLEDADPSRVATHTFTVATDSLFINGREGKTEIVTKTLEIASYFVFAFVDLNGNGYADDGEPQKLVEADGQPKKFALRENYTLMVQVGI